MAKEILQKSHLTRVLLSVGHIAKSAKKSKSLTM